MKTEEQMRAEFEAWISTTHIKHEGSFNKSILGTYDNIITRLSYEVWQARQPEIEALEERYKLLDAVFEALKATHDSLCDISRMQDKVILSQKEEIAMLREGLQKALIEHEKYGCDMGAKIKHIITKALDGSND